MVCSHDAPRTHRSSPVARFQSMRGATPRTKALRVGTRYHLFVWHWALPHRPSRAPPTRGTRSSGFLRRRSEADHRRRPEAARALSSNRSHLAARVAPVVDKAEHR
eukprot:5788029-Prymnesium_polylepis.1